MCSSHKFSTQKQILGTIVNVSNAFSMFDLFETRNVAVVKLLLVM